MNVDVTTEVVIGRPRAQVSAYAASPDNAPSWYGNIKSVEWKTPPPASVGSRIALVAQFLGRRMAYTYEIVEFIPNERLVMRTAEGPFPMETQYTWETIDGGNEAAKQRDAHGVFKTRRALHGPGRAPRESEESVFAQAAA